MNSTEFYGRYISENAAKRCVAHNVLWSSAMDLQVKLVNDGLMANYESPESAHTLPLWAQYQKQAYGTTYEPLAIVYNKRLLPPVKCRRRAPTSSSCCRRQAASSRARSRPTTSRNRVWASTT